MRCHQFGHDEWDEITAKERWLAAVSYLLFFAPFLWRRVSRFNRFHANQGLLLLLLALILWIGGHWIPVIGPFFIYPAGFLLLFILLFMGIMNALGGKFRALPLIGWIQILR